MTAVGERKTFIESMGAEETEASPAGSPEACQFSKRLPTVATFSLVTTWARVSIGTTEEMRIANEVFRKILAGGKTTTASR